MFIDDYTLNTLKPLWAIITPLTLFSLTMSITPGPNNIMLASSGARFGIKKTLPHYFGIPIGFISMLLATAYGLGWIFEQAPIVQSVLKYSSLCYLLYLSIKIMFSKAPQTNQNSEKTKKNKPMHLWESMLFQIINPKAFVMTTTAVSTFSLQGELYFKSILVMSLVFLATGPLGMGCWMFLGTVIGKLLKNPILFRSFNIVMGILTLGSAFFAF